MTDDSGNSDNSNHSDDSDDLTTLTIDEIDDYDDSYFQSCFSTKIKEKAGKFKYLLPWT